MNKNQERIVRGTRLSARPLGGGRFEITGGRQPHIVELNNASHPSCDCPDHNYRGMICMHINRALLAVGDTRTIELLGVILQEELGLK